MTPKRFNIFRFLVRRESWLFAISGLSLFALIVSLSYIYLKKDQYLTIERSKEHGDLIAQMFLSHVNRAFESTRDNMELLGQFWGKSNGEATYTSEINNELLFASLISGNGFIRSLTLTNLEGVVINSSESGLKNQTLNLELIGFTREITNDLEIGRSIKTRNLMDFQKGFVDPTSKSITLAKKVTLPNAAPSIVVAVINPDYLSANFTKFINSDSDAVYIFNYAGRIILSSQNKFYPTDSTQANMPAVKMIEANKDYGRYEESFNEVGASDTFLVSFRTSVNTPAIVGVAISKEQVLAEWWRDADKILLLTSLLALITLIITAAMTRMLRVREKYRVELSKSKRLAETANAAKSIFLANMSHEIRTPIHSMVGMTELALATKLTSEQREYLNMAKIASNNLLLLIDDILDFSRIGAGRMVLKKNKFNIHQCCQQVIKSFSLPADQKGLKLILDIDPSIPSNVLGDALRLGQILNNLIGNSIKFTKSGWIRLNVIPMENIQESHLFLKFQIIDTGIGINPQKIQDIFNAFSQEDASVTRRFGGSGLGLAIAKHLVDLMDGEIQVKSTTSNGSIFEFTAKFEALKSNDNFELHDFSSNSNVKFIVADFNPFAKELLLKMLSAWQIHASWTPTIFGLSNFISKNSADTLEKIIIIIDQSLLISNHSIFNNFSNELLSKIKIIQLTPIGQYADGIQLSNEIQVKKIVKPVTPSDLHNAILSLIADTAPYDALNDKDADTLNGQNRPAEAIAGLANLTLTTPSNVQQPTGRKVLVVEDTLMNQKLAQFTLAKLGVQVDIAENGEVGLAMRKKNHYDLILMDLQMPVMDGITACQAIREYEKTASLEAVPVVAMTAHVLDSDRQDCNSVGMNDFLVKPISVKDYERVLTRYLEKAAA